jgi:hypothetical protein
MAAGTPLTMLMLGAAPVAGDLGYGALNDLALALGDVTADCAASTGRYSGASCRSPAR